jgi:hypothetical protein
MLRGDNRRDSRPSRHVQCCHSHTENSPRGAGPAAGRCLSPLRKRKDPNLAIPKFPLTHPPLPSPSETRQLRQTSVIRSVSANGRSDDADVRAIDLRVSDLISLSHRAPALGCAPLEDDHEPLVAPEAAWPTTPNTTPIATGACPASVRVVLGICPASVRVVLGACSASVRVGCVPI